MSKFDLHIHSYFSKSLYGKILGPPSMSSPEDIIKWAIHKGVDVISVTDHDSVQGSLHAMKIAEEKYKGKIVIVPGVEVSSKRGHILAYNVYEDIPKKLSVPDTIKRIEDAGGVAVPAHPFNISYSISKRMATKLKDRFFAFEASNSHSLKNKQAHEFVNKYNLAYTVGSDAHFHKEIGLCHGETKKEIKTAEQMLKAIENKEITHSFTYNKKIVRRVFPYMIKTCFYWKAHQFKNMINKNKAHMPYKENIKTE